MPDGGSDCCGTCGFNKAMREIGSPSAGADSDEFLRLSHCVLRDTNITTPFWTYCDNYSHVGAAKEGAEIRGPIYADGLFEGWYCRIPWNGHHEARTNVAVTCSECGKEVESGVEVGGDEGGRFGFCCNDHYCNWMTKNGGG